MRDNLNPVGLSDLLGEPCRPAAQVAGITAPLNAHKQAPLLPFDFARLTIHSIYFDEDIVPIHLDDEVVVKATVCGLYVNSRARAA
jgi:hypothetical protein